MVGGRVGRYLRVGVYTTFGLFFFHFLHSYKICLHINTPVLFMTLTTPIFTTLFSHPPAFPSWCHSQYCTLAHPPDWLGLGCCYWQLPSLIQSDPGTRTARCEWWVHPGGKGRAETRTHLSIWNLLPEDPSLSLGSGQSERRLSVQTNHLYPGQKTSWEAAWEPEQVEEWEMISKFVA